MASPSDGLHRSAYRTGLEPDALGRHYPKLPPGPLHSQIPDELPEDPDREQRKGDGGELANGRRWGPAMGPILRPAPADRQRERKNRAEQREK